MVVNTKNYMVTILSYTNDYDKIKISKFDGEHYVNTVAFRDDVENVYENLQNMNEDEADAYINELYTSMCELAKIIDVNIFF